MVCFHPKRRCTNVIMCIMCGIANKNHVKDLAQIHVDICVNSLNNNNKLENSENTCVIMFLMKYENK